MKRFVIIAALLTACATQQQIPRGRLVDIGGRRLHLVCVGRGAPTVVFESGRAEGWSSWYLVQQRIGRDFRACAYDRAGFGLSDPRPDRSAAALVDDLHALLRAAHERPPYVLVGHSLGGAFVRRFAYTWPDEVAGLVLVDATHEDFYRSASPGLHAELQAGRERALERAREHLQSSREKGTWDEQWLPAENPPELRAHILPLTRWPKWWEARVAEMALPDVFEAVPSERRAFAVPVTVLWSATATKPDTRPADLHAEFLRNKATMQAELASRSRDGELITVETGHYIHIDHPDLVAEAIRKTAGRARRLQRARPQ